MEKSAVTEFFLEYFEKNRINTGEISEKIGIKKEKISENYGMPLSAEEFLKLCALLDIKPEEVREAIKEKGLNNS
ncbi:MAG: hypothetical protein IKL06_02100 [Lachnospiraceae bacterium]|nr:hypothetical protein [Lachnospiraceae bacterium]